MHRATILLIPWLCAVIYSNAQSPPASGDISSALRILLNANEYVEGGRLYREFLRRQEALKAALKLPVQSPPSMGLVNVFQPFKVIDNVLPQTSGFLQRLYNGYNVITQPFTGSIIGPGRRMATNLTELTQEAISKVTNKIAENKPREIPNVGGFDTGKEEGSFVVGEKKSERKNNIKSSMEEVDAPPIPILPIVKTVTEAPRGKKPHSIGTVSKEISAADYYHDYADQESSIPEADFTTDLDVEKEIPSVSFSDDGNLSHDAAAITEDYPRQSARRAPMKNGNYKQKSPAELADRIEELIKDMNITTKQAETVLRVFERVLEEELGNRDSQNSQANAGTKAPKVAGIKTRSDQNAFSNDDLTISYSVDEGVEKVEKANVVSSSEDSRETHTAERRLSFGRDADHIPGADIRLTPDQENDLKRPDIRERVQEVNSGHKKPTLTVSLPANHASPPNYKELEQAEYDKFIGSYRNRSSNPATSVVMTTQTVNTRTTAHTTVPTTTPSTTARSDHTVTPSVGGIAQRLNIERINPIPVSNANHVVPSVSRTPFERQVRDFRARLWGNNGFTDIVKALKNADIVFYESPTYNRYHHSR